jgi:N utilization substance protein B
MEHQAVLDAKIEKYLQSGWNLERLGSVMRSLLRVAVYELMEYEKLPIKVIINEYVNIAHRFFDRKDVSFVNGVLDQIAKEVRNKDA